jgi:transposase
VPDGRGLPLALEVSAGQAHEARWVTRLLSAIRPPRRGAGRPRRRPAALAGDRGYSFPGIRAWLRRHHVRAVIPTRRDQRPLRTFDQAAYRQRAVIEQRVGWLKERRRIATRFEKLAVHFLGVLNLAVLQLYLRVGFANTA